jgi:hypothetical protein
MIILSVGMPRAGSGWYYNIMHDLITAAGGQDARAIRQQYHLQRILTEVNCNIGALTPRRLLGVLIPSTQGNTFVIKAHSAPTPMARVLIRRNWMRVAYIYRDPRDALLSAFDNGQRAIGKGRPNAFSHLTDFAQSVEFMREYVRISEAWLGIPQVLHTRYESLKDDYDTEAARLAAFLAMEPASLAVRAVIDRYRPEKARQGQQGIHFNKGKTGRFRERMTPDEQQTLAQIFGPYLEKMGYPL